uniref:Uncharacterized protein n=2 Tax=unclassified bacterial viruses TaxID=12333 RepID=A0AAU6VY41_9VIRU
MKNIVKRSLAGVMGFLMVGMIAVEADAASRVSSSRSSFSSSRPSYSAPKSNYTAPNATAPSRSMSSNPGLKALGFGKPASVQTQSRPSASGSPSLNLSKPQPVVKTTTTSGGWFSKKQVSSVPAYKAPARKVVSPTAYRSQPRNVTVIQRNYYGGNGYGYNRGYGGGYYGGGYGYNNYGSGFGSSFAGTLGGMMVYNALFDNHSSTSTNATAAQIEQAKTDQRIEDKLDALKEDQNRIAYNNSTPVQSGATVGVLPVAATRPQCYMPEDAPLMMNPQFYCGGLNAK